MGTPRVAELRPSDIRRVMQHIVDNSLTPLRLDVGEPDQPTPTHVIDAAARATALPSRYAPAQGTPAFRQAASDYLLGQHGVDVSASDIVATTGATGGLAALFAMLTAVGDEVLVPSPGFPAYRSQLELLGVTAVGYPLREENGWLPDVREMESLVTAQTRAIVINSPGNPTGAVLDSNSIDGLVALAERHDLAIISDEVYVDLGLDGPAVSALSRNRDRVFSVFSLSKSFSMTGWRIGFCAVPPGYADTLGVVNAQFTASVSSVAQEAGRAALTGPMDHLVERRRTYAARRDAVHDFLRSRGIAHSVPQGSFYQLISLPPHVDSASEAFALLDEGVAVVPGTAFGQPAGPFVRLCLTAPVETLISGLEIITAYFDIGQSDNARAV